MIYVEVTLAEVDENGENETLGVSFTGVTLQDGADVTRILKKFLHPFEFLSAKVISTEECWRDYGGETE